MIFWIAYFFLSLLICLFVSKLFNNFYLRFTIFLILMTCLCSFWFVKPGNMELAPIFSIILLENSISDNNGLIRVIRPMGVFFIIFSISFFLIRNFFKS